MDYTQGAGGRVASTLGLSGLRSTLIQSAQKISASLYALNRYRYPTLVDLMKRMKSTAVGVDGGDYVLLYSTVVKRKPRAILELGAGKSSNVIALAIRDARRLDPTYKPYFLAVEDVPKWYEEHKRAFIPELREFCDLQCVPCKKTSVAGVPAMYYDGLPDFTWDFLHVDGPDLVGYGAVVSCDFLTLKLSDRAIVIFDGREATARFTAKHTGMKVSRHPGIWSYVLHTSSPQK